MLDDISQRLMGALTSNAGEACYHNTESVDAMRFWAHGNVVCTELEPGVVLYKACGPFNKELIQALIEIEQKTFPDYAKKWGKWAEIVVLSEDCLFTHEAVAAYQQFLSSSKQQGTAPLFSAYVFGPDVANINLGKYMFAKMYKESGLSFNAFTCVAEGLLWIKDSLAKR